MNDKRQGYYAALEREAKVRRQVEDMEALDSEYLYTELGMKAYSALGNIFEWISGLSTRSARQPGINAETALKAMQVANNLQERLEEIEKVLKVIASGISRIDKFTLEAFRKMDGTIQTVNQLSTRLDSMDAPVKSDETGSSLPEGEVSENGQLPKPARRMHREDVRELAIATARAMAREGKKVTLSSVARNAGLKYSQITYAFQDKQAFLDAINGKTEEVEKEGEKQLLQAAGDSSSGAN